MRLAIRDYRKPLVIGLCAVSSDLLQWRSRQFFRSVLHVWLVAAMSIRTWKRPIVCGIQHCPDLDNLRGSVRRGPPSDAVRWRRSIRLKVSCWPLPDIDWIAD